MKGTLTGTVVALHVLTAPQVDSTGGPLLPGRSRVVGAAFPQKQSREAGHGSWPWFPPTRPREARGPGVRELDGFLISRLSRHRGLPGFPGSTKRHEARGMLPGWAQPGDERPGRSTWSRPARPGDVRSGMGSEGSEGCFLDPGPRFRGNARRAGIREIVGGPEPCVRARAGGLEPACRQNARRPEAGEIPCGPIRRFRGSAREPGEALSARFRMRKSHLGVDGFGEVGGRGVEDVVFTRLLTPLVAAGRS